MMRRGFTLLELIVVIIILGILATLGFTQYVKMVEKGRTAEAKAILGDIRTALEAYHFEYNTYNTALSNLPVDSPTAASGTHYFTYAIPNAASNTFSAVATRTITTAGKTPPGPSAYTITLTNNGTRVTWGGTAGFY